jgi:hypothetical protein
MRHRKATVGMIGACMLWMALVGLAGANEFYTAGTAREVEGADNLGKTIVHYAVSLGLPLLSVGLIGGGLVRLKENPGKAGGAIGGGITAGYLAGITKNLHSDAAAAVSLSDLTGSLAWPAVAVSLILQATLVAILVCYVRGRLTCGRNAGASLTSR